MEENYKNIENNIINKLKTEISINEFRKEIFEKKYNSKTKLPTIIKRIIISLLSLTTVCGTVIFAYNYKIFKNIDNLNISYALLQNPETDSIKNASDNGYIENINMHYSYSNQIGCKLNSFTISDNNLSIVIDFDFSNLPISHNNLFAKIIIYDENKNIYCNYSPAIRSSKDVKYQKKFYKNVGLSEDSEISSMITYTTLYETQTKVISQLLLSDPNIQFPISDKLYINIHDIGYIENDEYIYLYKDIDWNFEIDIPEKFRTRTNDIYKLVENIEGFNLEDFYITDTHTTLTYSSDYWDTIIQIIDENGNIYESYSGNKIDDNNYRKNYQLNKYMVTDKLYLKIIKGSDVIKQVELKKI